MTPIDAMTEQETLRGSTLGRAGSRLVGATALTGAAVMLAGAALYFSAGADADLPAALATATMPTYLAAVAGNGAIVANLSLWILGAVLMGSVGTGFAVLGRARPAVAGLGAAAGLLGAATAITAFVAWLTLVVVVAPTGDPELATAIGWFAWHLDVVATALIVGIGPLCYSLAGRRIWAPRWLVVWGVIAGAVAVQSLAVPYLPALADTSLLIVPVGLGWIIAAGTVVLRRANHPAAP